MSRVAEWAREHGIELTPWQAELAERLMVDQPADKPSGIIGPGAQPPLDPQPLSVDDLRQAFRALRDRPTFHEWERPG